MSRRFRTPCLRAGHWRDRPHAGRVFSLDGISQADRDDFIEAIFENAEHSVSTSLVEDGAAHLESELALATAMEGRAGVMVNGGTKLLRVKVRRGVSIIGVRALLDGLAHPYGSLS